MITDEINEINQRARMYESIGDFFKQATVLMHTANNALLVVLEEHNKSKMGNK